MTLGRSVAGTKRRILRNTSATYVALHKHFRHCSHRPHMVRRARWMHPGCPGNSALGALAGGPLAVSGRRGLHDLTIPVRPRYALAITGQMRCHIGSATITDHRICSATIRDYQIRSATTTKSAPQHTLRNRTNKCPLRLELRREHPGAGGEVDVHAVSSGLLCARPTRPAAAKPATVRFPVFGYADSGWGALLRVAVCRA